MDSEELLDDDASFQALESEEKKTLTLQVAANQARERIDKFLTRQVENATRNKVQEAIEESRVLVNGKPVKSNYKVCPNDEILIIFTHPPAPKLEPENIPLDIIFEDEFLLVINKPAGMVVHPAYANWTGTLAGAVLYHTQNQLSQLDEAALRPGIVHRLDKDTSGLIVVAKDDTTHYALAKQFAERTIEKTYTALVWGCPTPASGTIQSNIGRSKRDRKIMANYPFESETGKPAITDYEVKEDFHWFSLLDVRLHTGRTHQIRAHLQHLGHPILSDEAYGGKFIRKLAFPRSEAFVRNLFQVIPRQALHAKKLGFTHPATENFVTFEATLPEDMEQAIQKMKTLSY